MLPRTGYLYQCFTKSTNEDEARHRYMELHGVEPESCFVYKQLLWVGPVREVPEQNHLNNNWKVHDER